MRTTMRRRGDGAGRTATERRRASLPACVGDIGLLQRLPIEGGWGPLGRTVRAIACESVGPRATFEDDDTGGT
jgi:hypothetical protein